jgi:hypothetical protein
MQGSAGLEGTEILDITPLTDIQLLKVHGQRQSFSSHDLWNAQEIKVRGQFQGP